ncbi:hypothetical protein RND71_009858 [Anisodus tanguticus]|uniref:Uncharacterized protein n=1 Tax=Anisodus tanguticus TaxID=243964 RepID=A0AAE1SJ85_9SOLA|nr:hypothetical protein RND71_009858 [Anisodus tanguticus]
MGRSVGQSSRSKNESCENEDVVADVWAYEESFHTNGGTWFSHPKCQNERKSKYNQAPI